MTSPPTCNLPTAVLMALLAFILTSSSVNAVDNWPDFRGPTHQGRADDADPPIEWGEEKNVVWKTAVDGKAWSSPVIWGDRVFVTNAPPEGSRLMIHCLDKNSGKVLYKKKLYTVPLPQYCHPFNSYASCSPVLEDGRVYVSFGSPYNACLDAKTGNVIWERTDFECNHFRGPGSSPCLYKDSLILHFDGSDYQYLVALNKNTGETIWRTDRSVDFDDIDPKTGKPEREGDWRKAYSTPLVAEFDGQAVLLSLGSMAMYGYNPDNGEELWRVEFVGSHSGACRPVVTEDTIYQPTGSGAELWSIKPGGKGVVTETHVNWKDKGSVPRRSSVLHVDGLLYMVTDLGVAACLDAKTGERIWRERVGGNFSASLIHANGRIYFFDQEGKATVIKAGRDYEVLATSRLDEGFMASPAVSGNALFVRTKTHVYRIEG